MKDQVDALVDRGVAAACVNSTLSPGERRGVANEIPRRPVEAALPGPRAADDRRDVAIPAGCETFVLRHRRSSLHQRLGHDFRPEYRALGSLKSTFPGVAIHAFTATATERVRDDIARELRLENPEILVGSFDRPNLVYRANRRTDLLRQVCEVIDRHADESGIIYTIRRADVEELATSLTEAGYSALPYHAGIDDAGRHKNQDAFIAERAKIIVARWPSAWASTNRTCAT